MDKSDETYGGPERRREINVELRAIWANSFKKISHSSEVTEDDLNQLFELMRNYYGRGHGERSSEILQFVRAEPAGDLSPAMLTFLDSVLGND